MPDEPLLDLVRRALERVTSDGSDGVVDSRASAGSASPADGSTPSAPTDAADLPTVRAGGLCDTGDVEAARQAGAIRVEAGTIVTPMARDLAEHYGVRLVETDGAGDGVEGTAARRVAIAADHGGFELKEELERWLREEMGRLVTDHGTHGPDSCDYPDYASEAAIDVARGRAAFGIVVDGAGIGSCMTANKVPGVLAATCWNEASARNAREHNRANVLCLGSGFLTPRKARAICRAFLETPFGGGRHGRRVGKILDVEEASLLAAARDRALEREETSA